ncbi:hypothetical protein DQX44_18575, partial [Salmonella enterica]|nr:hypothetical protein [Salmonella enterica]EBJ2256432.1 hypothetical protein [Salmonella enterica]
KKLCKHYKHPTQRDFPFKKNKLFHFYGKTSSMHASLIFKKDHFFCFFWNIHEINILKVLHIIFYEQVRSFSS